MSKNFTATRRGVAITVGTSSNAQALDDDLTFAAVAPDVLIDNRGGADAYILLGGEDTEVTVETGVRIPAGSLAIYGKGSATHVAVIAAAPGTLTVHLGEGL